MAKDKEWRCKVEGCGFEGKTEATVRTHVHQTHNLFHIALHAVSGPDHQPKVAIILQRESALARLRCPLGCENSPKQYSKLASHLTSQHYLPPVEWSATNELTGDYRNVPCNRAFWRESQPGQLNLPPANSSPTTPTIAAVTSVSAPANVPVIPSANSMPTRIVLHEVQVPVHSPSILGSNMIQEGSPLVPVADLLDNGSLPLFDTSLSSHWDHDHDTSTSTNNLGPSVYSLPTQADGKENAEFYTDSDISREMGGKRSALQASLEPSSDVTIRRSKRQRQQVAISYYPPTSPSPSPTKTKSIPPSNKKPYFLPAPANPQWTSDWKEADLVLSGAGLFLVKEFALNHMLVIACMRCQKGLSVNSQFGGYKHHVKDAHKLIAPDILDSIDTWIKKTKESLKFSFANHAGDLQEFTKNPRPPLFGFQVIPDGYMCTFPGCCKGFISKASGETHFGVSHSSERHAKQPKVRTAHIQRVFEGKSYFEVLPLQMPLTQNPEPSSSTPLSNGMNYSPLETRPWDYTCDPPAVPETKCLFLEKSRWDIHLSKLNLTGRQQKRLATLAVTGSFSARRHKFKKPLRLIIREYQLKIIDMAHTVPQSVRTHLAKDHHDPSRTKKPWKPSPNPLLYASVVQKLVTIVCELLCEGSSPSNQVGFDLNLSLENRQAAEALFQALERHCQAIDESNGNEGFNDDSPEEIDEVSFDEDNYLDWDDDDEDDEDEGENEGEQDTGECDGMYGGKDSNSANDEDLGSRSAENQGNRYSLADERTLLRTRDSIADCVKKLHLFLKQLLLSPIGVNELGIHTTPPKVSWGVPIDRCLALFGISHENGKGGFNFKPAEKLTQLFAALHYHIRGAILYDAASVATTNVALEVAVKQAADLNFDYLSQTPYAICARYQKIASTISHNIARPATTTVSPDGMSFTYCGETLHIPTLRQAIKDLVQTATASLDRLCRGETAKLPQLISDDWVNDERGYSWTKNDPNRFGQIRRLPILVNKALNDAEKPIVKCVPGSQNLELDYSRMGEIEKECATVNKLLFLLAFFTAGQPPRASEIANYKFANSTRARNMVAHDGSLWLLKRRAKTESAERKERVVPSQLCPAVSALFVRYLILVRPLERHLALHRYPNNPNLGSYLSEYLWIQNGKKMTSDQARTTISCFLREKAHFLGGISGYRQLCTQIIRVFIGSEGEACAEDGANLANASYSGPHRLYCASLPEGSNTTPGISSTLVRRYGRASQDWWEIWGIKPGCDPMKTLHERGYTNHFISHDQKSALTVDEIYGCCTRGSDIT